MAPNLAQRTARRRLAARPPADVVQALAVPLSTQRSEQSNAAVWERLIALPLVADYQRAFASATGPAKREQSIGRGRTTILRPAT